MKTINEKFGLTADQENAVAVILNRKNKRLRSLSTKEVIANFNDIDSQIYNELKNTAGLLKVNRMVIKNELLKAINNPYFLNGNHPALAELKKQSFDDCASDLSFYAIEYLKEYQTNYSFADLVAVGYEALEKAWLNYILGRTSEDVKRCQKENKVVYSSFKTYGQNYIRWKMSDVIRKERNANNRVTDLPRTLERQLNLIIDYVDRHISMGYGEPTIEMIVEATKLDKTTVLSACKLLNVDKTKIVDDKLTSQFAIDYVCKTFEDSSLNGFERALLNDSKETLNNVLLENLSAKEYFVVCSTFGLCGVKRLTLEEIGKEIKLSRERARQIKVEACSKLSKLSDVVELLEIIVKLDNQD